MSEGQMLRSELKLDELEKAIQSRLDSFRGFGEEIQVHNLATYFRDLLDNILKSEIEEERKNVVAWLKNIAGCDCAGGIEAGSHIPVKGK
jgi:hypothetical protein